VEQDQPSKGHTPLQEAGLAREYLLGLGW